ncbi:MAG: TraR/DksA C4-type zinc finger protein [Bryobacteraceae bacterium]
MKLLDFHLKLLEKQSECQSGLAALEKAALRAGQGAVRDSMDDATVSQGTSEALEEATIVSQTLEEVQDALRRVDAGIYGLCTACGREIEPARLEAVCWAAYCLEDQQKQDRLEEQRQAQPQTVRFTQEVAS